MKHFAFAIRKGTGVGLSVLSLTLTCSATDYYIDASGGSDSNGGTAATNAWQTLARASGASHTFGSGDRILLKRGETFPGKLYFNGDSGVAVAPIVIGAYGVGAPPIIDAAGHLAGVHLENSKYVEVRDLEITADGGVTVDGSNPALRHGVYVNVLWNESADSIIVTNLHIHDIFPEIGEASEGATPTTFKGTAIAIRGNGNSTVNFPATHIRVEDCVIERTGYKAIEINRANDVEVLNNRMKEIGGPAIQPGRSTDLVVRGNVVDGSGSFTDPRMHGRGSGIWPWTCDRVLIEGNTFMHARGRADSCGMHIDFNCNDVVVQYNLSINNAGGFIEILGNNNNCTYRYNISINDGWRVKGVLDQGTIANNQDGHILWISGYVGSGNPYSGPFNSYLYNNTVYVKGDITSTFSIQESTEGLLIANNIFYVEGPTTDVTGDFADDYTQAMADRVVWHNNLYQRTGIVPTFNLDLFTDTNQIIGDPQFANTGGTNAVDYLPAAATFVQDQGIVITNIPGDPVGLLVGLTVTQDFFGNPVTGLPDMGAIEMTGSPVVPLVLVGGSIRNGDFNANPGTNVAFVDTAEWYNLGGGQSVQCTRDDLAYDGSQNAVLTAARDFAIDPDHTMAEGDVFDVRYVWRDAWNWVDAADEMRVTLFVTDTDTLTGARTDVAVDLSGVSTADSTYEVVVRPAVYTATASVAGKRLFAMVDCDSEGFARVDNFQLSVTRSVPPILEISSTSGLLTIQWMPAGGTLHSAASVVGPWTSLGTGNPYQTSATNDARFYRVIVP